MPTIALTKGQRARVDWEDYKELSRHKWCARWSSKTKSFYATRGTWLPGVRRVRSEQMHRRVLDLEYGDPRHVDHINHDTLDNRRRNLRAVAPRENGDNRRDQSKCGVGVVERAGRFGVCVNHKGKKRWLGTFDTAEEAREARRGFWESHE